MSLGSARLVIGAMSAWSTPDLPPRAAEKCSLRGELTVPTSACGDPGDSRNRLGRRARPRVARRIGGDVARDAPGAFFGSPRHGAQGRPDSPRPPRPRPRDASPRSSRGANRRGNRGAAAARRVLPTFERRAQDHAKRPAAVPRGGGASFATSDRAVRRPNRCRLSHGLHPAAAGSVSTRRGGTFGRVAPLDRLGAP